MDSERTIMTYEEIFKKMSEGLEDRKVEKKEEDVNSLSYKVFHEDIYEDEDGILHTDVLEKFNIGSKNDILRLSELIDFLNSVKDKYGDLRVISQTEESETDEWGEWTGSCYISNYSISYCEIQDLYGESFLVF